MAKQGILTVDQSPTRKTPLYEQVKVKLKKTIEVNRLSRGDKMPNIYALAKEWNVNYRTLRSAFAGLEKEGVLTYEHNRGAVVGTRNVEKKVSICCIRWQRDAFWVALSTGIKRFCKEMVDVDCTTVDPQRSQERLIDAIKHPCNGTNGFLIDPEEGSEYTKAIKETIKAGNEVVLLDRTIPDIGACSVSADHFTGAYEATIHLWETHNRPVYYLGRVHEGSSSRLWVEGWSEAMREHNIFDLDSFIFDLGETEKEHYAKGLSGKDAVVEAAKKLFRATIDKGEKYSIFAGNNYTARGIYIACEEFGLKVGRDIFVVGSGDAPRPQTFSTPLSAIWQNTEQVGYEGAKLLYGRITGELKKPVDMLLPTKLRIRTSSTGQG